MHLNQSKNYRIIQTNVLNHLQKKPKQTHIHTQKQTNKQKKLATFPGYKSFAKTAKSVG